MSNKGSFRNSLLTDTESIVERLRACLDAPDSGPAIEAWLHDVYQPGSINVRPTSSSRVSPPTKWEIEHDFYYPRYLVARELERKARYEDALNIYDLILKVFEPRGTLYYERPAILLERMGRYDEAIVICNRAIRVIEAKLFHGDAEPFRRRRARLLTKKERKETHTK